MENSQNCFKFVPLNKRLDVSRPGSLSYNDSIRRDLLVNIKGFSFFSQTYVKWTTRIISVLVFLIVWQIVAAPIGSDVLPTPLEVGTSLVTLLVYGTLLSRLVQTLSVFLVGYTISALAGITIGAAMARFKSVETALDPYINALIATPWVVLIPLFVIWFGTGVYARIAIIVISVIFPVIINTLSGFKNVNRGYIETARSFGCTGFALYRKTILPAALPYIIAGLRIAIVIGLAAALLAEMFLQIVGLGYLILVYQVILQIANMLAIVFVIALIGLSLTELLKYFERKLAPWRVATTGG
jgi:ABC-type nitrate/sulfonate/bicarbonate transport system permease component